MAEERLLTRGFVLANLTNLLFFTGVTTFFVLPVHLEHLGGSRAEIGHVMGSFGVTSMLTIPLTGLVVDCFGRRPFMLAGAILWGLLSVVLSTVTEMGVLLYAVRMLQGMAFALAFVATNALVVDLAPRGALGRALAVFGTTTLATHALGPSVGELILKTAGFRALCFVSMAAAASAVVMSLNIAEPARAPRSAGGSGAGTSLVALAIRPGAWSALIGGVTSALAFGSAMIFMPVFVHTRGIASFAPFFLAYTGAAAGVRLVAGGMGDRFGHRRVSATALCAFAVAVASFALVRSTPVLIALALVFGVAHGWAYPSLNALVVGEAPEAARGRAMSLFNLSFNAGVTLAAFGGGEIAERFGYSAMWLTMAAASLIGVVALLSDGSRRAPAPT